MCRRFSWTLLVLLPFAAACVGAPQSEPSPQRAGSRRLPPVGAEDYEPPRGEPRNATSMPARLAIASEEDWRRVAEMFGWATDVPSGVDFGRNMLIVVAAGVRGESGYHIWVDSVYEGGDELLVIVRHQSPGRNCATLQMEQHPVHVVRTPHVSSHVRFVERAEVHECGH